MEIPLNDVAHFDVTTHNPGTGVASDADATPTFEVFEEDTDTDVGVGGSMTKRTSKTGNYRGQFAVTVANGFEVGKWYNVIASATVQAVSAKTVAMRFRVKSENLEFTVPAIGRGTVTTGASTTSVPTSAFAPAGAAVDQFKDRTILFDVNTATTTLRGCARAITASTNAATPTLTVDALPAAPASGDTFSVI